MNGLALRISKVGTGKVKNSSGFSPVIFPHYEETCEDTKKSYILNFRNASSAEAQLAGLRDYLTKSDLLVDEELINFLVSVFLYSEVKHPVKCFLTRHITRTKALEDQFIKALALKLQVFINKEPDGYKPYVDVVTRLLCCTENFPSGAEALKMLELSLLDYLTSGLDCSHQILRDPSNPSHSNSLSPTEINEMYNLEHSILRLLLYIIQKTSNIKLLEPKFERIKFCIEHLLFDDDLPMDTKSIGGILYLTILLLEKGPNAWIEIFETPSSNPSLSKLLTNDSAKLSLASAIATIVPVDRLRSSLIGDENGLMKLTKYILAIGERTSADSPFTLGVSRAVAQISKQLDIVGGNRTVPGNEGAIGNEGELSGLLLSHSWHQLEHHMDSVRHLAGHTLARVVRHCVALDRNGDPGPLEGILSCLHAMDRSRKSYVVVAGHLAAALGAPLLGRSPHIREHLLQCLQLQPLQATAASALESLLTSHMSCSPAAVTYAEWVRPVLSHVTSHVLHAAELRVLEDLLVTAVRNDHRIIDHILPHIKQASDPKSEHYNLKCVLMLLSVCRKSNVPRLSTETDDEWRGVISYDVLKLAAVNEVDETRILCLSLVVESSRSTEELTPGELRLVLYYLAYNINSQSPNFRQLTLSLLKKFIKRFEGSYKVLVRQEQPSASGNKSDYYLSFMDSLRKQCFDSLLEGANYSRRYVALQVLVWCARIELPGYNVKWTEEYVERLLLHLEDSYENNKGFALEILLQCPDELLKSKSYSTSLELAAILEQASEIKPTECVSAAYKLELLLKKLPGNITDENNSEPEFVACSLIEQLLDKIEARLNPAGDGEGAGRGRGVGGGGEWAGLRGEYGLVHCITHCLRLIDPDAISRSARWRRQVAALVRACGAVSAGAGGVVSAASPEGHLPCDLNRAALYHNGNSCGMALEDGRLVTSQMVLLCAWRAVKEVSLLLGVISSRMSIEGEGAGPQGLVQARQLLHIGDHFTRLLAETKHRGAFEQAYIGFTMLLTRLWRCRTPELHSLPARWLNELISTISRGSAAGTLCATRRSAGLPFMIQALVTTELQVHSNPKCFHHCMATLLKLAKSYPEQLEGNKSENFRKDSGSFQDLKEKEALIETCTHSLNILRALFRNSALDESVGGYVGEGLVVAFMGFQGETWGVRNSSTLLLSALLSRVFGVGRAAAGPGGARNRMTGRIFFLRYPMLYDFILKKLQGVPGTDRAHEARYPVLLLLARLDRSALDGTVSHLKLAAFVPHVFSCGRSAVLKTRQLAARAIVPLISPVLYIENIEHRFQLLCDQRIERNFCHGLLLQLTRLLDSRPTNISVDVEPISRLQSNMDNSLWILEQALPTRDRMPCYLIADEYAKIINLLILRFPELITEEFINKVEFRLGPILFQNTHVEISSGREVCLANLLYLYFVVLNQTNVEKIPDLIIKSLKHQSYDVIISCLNYLLILYGKLESTSKMFEEHLQVLSEIKSNQVICELRKRDSYIQTIDSVFKTNTYLEVKQKCLKILTLEEDTQKYIVNVKITDDNITDEVVINMLFDKIESEHENFVHLYLDSCVKMVSRKLKEKSIDAGTILNVLRVVFACSASDNDERTREVALNFLGDNLDLLFGLNVDGLSDGEAFEYKATIWSAVATLLEDDNEAIRQQASNSLRHLSDEHSAVIASKRVEELKGLLEARGEAALCLVLALLDFKSEVCMNDEVNDECRVFDQNEKYNVFMEETIWTNDCADIIKKICKKQNLAAKDYVLSIIESPTYKGVYEKLCNNLDIFKKMLTGDFKERKSDALNPKLRLFVRLLSE